jgi:LPPG:FO 2-phospho-L-lactate transferase
MELLMDKNDAQIKTQNSKFEIRNSKSGVGLAGGVGGAKLAGGLQAVLPGGGLSVVVNTADDFRLWGLHISPDLDSVMYMLGGIANPATGWGVAEDTWNALKMVEQYGRDVWFRLGDMDFVTHILRTQMLSEGRTLTQATADLASALKIPSRILPMCDESVQTVVETPDGALEFQDYFVRRRHADTVLGVSFRGVEEARPTPEALAAIEEAEAIIFCPSNPIVSIGPILALPGMVDALRQARGVKVAVSPIVGGAALKGPAADMLRTLGHEVSPAGVAAMYRGLVDGMVIDSLDKETAAHIEDMGIEVEVTDTIMDDEADREALASETLEFCGRLMARKKGTG